MHNTARVFSHHSYDDQCMTIHYFQKVMSLFLFIHSFSQIVMNDRIIRYLVVFVYLFQIFQEIPILNQVSSINIDSYYVINFSTSRNE